MDSVLMSDTRDVSNLLNMTAANLQSEVSFKSVKQLNKADDFTR